MGRPCDAAEVQDPAGRRDKAGVADVPGRARGALVVTSAAGEIAAIAELDFETVLAGREATRTRSPLSPSVMVVTVVCQKGSVVSSTSDVEIPG